MTVTWLRSDREMLRGAVKTSDSCDLLSRLTVLWPHVLCMQCVLYRAEVRMSVCVCVYVCSVYCIEQRSG